MFYDKMQNESEKMFVYDGPLAELYSLVQAAQFLRRARRPRSVQSLYDRIRRGTLYAVRVGRDWYIPRSEVRRLARQPYHRKGGRPRLHPGQAALGWISFDVPAASDSARLAKLTVAKRGRAQLEAQAFLRGTIRARLHRTFPELSPREISTKLLEELATHD